MSREVKLIEFKSLRFENLTFAFEGRNPIFSHANFEFPLNQIAWVQAESGEGRSTLLQLMAALLQPGAGSYKINDVDIVDLSFEEFLPFRMQIGYGFDMGGVIHNRTVIENLTLPLLYHQMLAPKLAIKRAEKYMDRLGILKYRDQRPSHVPGGVRKMTCLLRALIMHPQVLLLDDPTVGVGRDFYLQYFDLVSDLRSMGYLQHIFMSSFDSQLVNILKPIRIAIDNGQLYHYEVDGEKKAASL